MQGINRKYCWIYYHCRQIGDSEDDILEVNSGSTWQITMWITASHGLKFLGGLLVKRASYTRWPRRGCFMNKHQHLWLADSYLPFFWRGSRQTGRRHRILLNWYEKKNHELTLSGYKKKRYITLYDDSKITLVIGGVYTTAQHHIVAHNMCGNGMTFFKSVGMIGILK